MFGGHGPDCTAVLPHFFSFSLVILDLLTLLVPDGWYVGFFFRHSSLGFPRMGPKIPSSTPAPGEQ